MPFHWVIRLLQPVEKPAHVTAIFQINGIYISCFLEYYSLDLCIIKLLVTLYCNTTHYLCYGYYCLGWKTNIFTICVNKILLDSWKHHILQGKHLIGRALWCSYWWCFRNISWTSLTCRQRLPLLVDSTHHFAIVSRIFCLNRLSAFFFNIVSYTIHGLMSTPVSYPCVKLLSFFQVWPLIRFIVL